MTLREQIKAIHAKHFNKEFHEYRQDLIPAMVNDLKLKFFDDLERYVLPSQLWWCIPDSVDVRVVRRASELIAVTGLRENTPAVE